MLLNRRQLAGLVVGAAATSSIAAAHVDQITQREIRDLYLADAAKTDMALSLRRRVDAGASIEAGAFSLVPSRGAVDERDWRGPFDCAGFDHVSFNECHRCTRPATLEGAIAAGRAEYMRVTGQSE